MTKYLVSIFINGDWAPVKVPDGTTTFSKALKFCKEYLKNIAPKDAETIRFMDTETFEIWELDRDDLY